MSRSGSQHYTLQSRIRWGIGSYTYGWSTGAYGASYKEPGAEFLSVPQLLQRAVEAAVPVVQIALRPDILQMTTDELRDVAASAARHGVEIETGTSGTDPGHLRAYLRASEHLSARLVRTILRGDGVSIERSGNDLVEIVPDFERSGVRLAIENFEAFSSRRHAELIRGLDSPFVGSCIDTVNNLGRGEGTLEVLSELLPTVFCLHLKDFVSIRSRADSGFEITGARLGTGVLPIEQIVDVVLATRPDASLIIEQWIPYQGTREATVALETQWAGGSIHYLRALAEARSLRSRD